MLRLFTCVCAPVLAIAEEAAAQPSGGAELFLKNCSTGHSLTGNGLCRAIIEYPEAASTGGESN